jgi:predicted DNA-binding transcriptional regulator AlpA
MGRHGARPDPEESRKTQSTDEMPRLTLRLDEVAKPTGMSVRTVQRMISAGRFPGPTCKAGRKVPMWSHAIIEQWVCGEWKPVPEAARRKAEVAAAK